jgi:hypothetical protein
LNDGLQVWRLWAVYDYQTGFLASSRWCFVTLRDTGITQQDLAELWSDVLQDYYTMNRPTDWTLVRVAVEDVWPGTAAEWVYTYPVPVNPGPGGPGTPPQVSPVLPWDGGHPGRSYRGRTFWGPVLRAHADEGFLNVDGRSAPNFFGFELANQFGPAGDFNLIPFAILSRQHDLTPTNPPQWVRPRYFGVDSSLRTIRRRQKMPRILI